MGKKAKKPFQKILAKLGFIPSVFLLSIGGITYNSDGANVISYFLLGMGAFVGLMSLAGIADAE